jgi:ribosome-binding factor A
VSESRRVQRIEKELQHIVANYILRDFRGQLSGLVSVSRVESNPKLRTAKVYISVMGSEADRDNAIDFLNENIRHIQHHVNKQLHMKFVPRLSIVLDEGLEKLLKVETLLREISLKKSSEKNSEEE